MKLKTRFGVTLIELTVVVLILAILSTIAVSVYTGHTQRARFAVARVTVRNLEFSAHRYELDLGVFPPSSSGNTYGTLAVTHMTSPDGGTFGCGYLMLCLLHSYSGNAYNPASSRWNGPYMETDQEQMGDLQGGPVVASTPVSRTCLLDPWGTPYYYVRASDYDRLQATRQQGLTASGSLGETYYNPISVQIFSLGPDGTTPAPPAAGLGTDDINNFFTP